MPCADSKYWGEEIRREEMLHNSPVAELLCKTLHQVEDLGLDWLLDPPTMEWWLEHKRRDAKKSSLADRHYNDHPDDQG